MEGDSVVSTAADAAYETLRGEILSGTRAMGQRLGEQEISRSLAISRTPLREALRRLESDGIVEITPQRGARVISPTVSDLLDIFDLREQLEAAAAEAAATKISSARIEELSDLAERLEDLASKPRSAEFDIERTNNNSRFHDLLLISSERPKLREMARGLMMVPLVVGTFGRYTDSELQRSARHHTEIVEALRAGDGIWAGSVMRSHIRAARNTLTRSMPGQR